MTTNIPSEFARYDVTKYNQFKDWLATDHGQSIYTMFAELANKYRSAGQIKCSTTLIANRVRWEQDTDKRYSGFKIPNNWIPLLGRQLVVDDPSFNGFFKFQKPKKADQ